MLKILSISTAFLFAILAVPVQAAGPAEIVDSFHAALQRGDKQAAAALLSADALIFEAGHVERSAAEYAGGHLAGDAAHAAKTRTTYGARRCILGSDLAVIASETVSTALEGGDPRAGTETMVLTRSGSSWRIGHIHWSSRKLPLDKSQPSSKAAPAPCE
jgi:ketosteroid isomerase-like protein